MVLLVVVFVERQMHSIATLLSTNYSSSHILFSSILICFITHAYARKYTCSVFIKSNEFNTSYEDFAAFLNVVSSE